jgi:glycosyltransferase involved in cell wall biosynthesis
MIPEPLVSVIMPAYNTSGYIKEAAYSVLNQSYRNIELIIVDDGSTDHTLKVANHIAVKDSRVKVFSIPPAGRPSIPRNYGIKQSSGELIAFIDSDDLWLPGKLKSQVKTFLKHKDISFVYSTSFSFGEVNIFSPEYEVLPLPVRAAHKREDLIKIGNTIPLSSVLASAEKIGQLNGFDEDPELKVEDYDMWLRLSELAPFYYIPRLHVLYRIRKGQFSADWEAKKERLEYLSHKRNLPLPQYKAYRRKGGLLLLIRNFVHFKVYWGLRILGFFDKIIK